MNKSTSNIFIIISFIIVGLVILFAIKSGSSASNQIGTILGSKKIRLTDTTDAQSAYLISTDTYDATTTLALTGFTVTKTPLSDGTLQITLGAQKTEYKDQTYVLKPGENLYFIERFLQDDINGEEKNLKDDTAVVVDADGFVVQ